MDESGTSIFFALAAFAIGGYGLFKGTLTFNAGEGNSDPGHQLSGRSARIVSAVLVFAGCVLLIDLVVGIVLLLGAIVLAWVLSR